MGIFGGVALALALAAVPGFLVFALFLLPAGYPFAALFVPFVQMGGFGLLALCVLVFWRLRTGAARPSWPFIFFASGAVNVVIWSVVTAAGTAGADSSQAGSLIELTPSYGLIAFIVAIVWGIAGLVFGRLRKEHVPGGSAR